MDELGQRLQAALPDRYAVERELGRGGMATVFLARDLKHHRRVAIKVLRPEIANAIGIERFLQEIEIAAQLTHPHILPLFESGKGDGLVYYVMPYIEGESLRDRLDREKELPLDDAIRIAKQVAGALAHAHSQGIVHRDIKPGNILLEGNDAVVADFGIARAISSAGGTHLTQTGVTLGTPAYMSPEQAGGEAAIDGRSDIYSLGCVLYEMLGGEPPFTGPSSQAVIARQMQEEPRSLRIVRPAVPPGIETAVRTALEKVPADRFSTASQFIDALEHPMASEAPVLARPGHWARWLAAVIGVAALFAIAVAIRRGTGQGGDRVSVGSLDPMHVAVLFFTDQTQGHQLDHLASSITLDLIDLLGKVELLTVISGVGVQPFRGSQAPLDSIAEALHVGTIISGSVDSVGRELRVAVRLIDASTGQQLSSHEFRSPWGDARALTTATAAEASLVLQRLGSEIRTRQARSGTTSGPAWRLFQTAMDLWSDARAALPDRKQEARQLLWRVDTLLADIHRLDPEWTTPIVQQGALALLQASLADGSVMQDSARPGHTARSKIDWLREGMVDADRALSRSPHDPYALAVRGRLRYRLWEELFDTESDSLRGAEEDLTLAVTREPQLATAWYTLSELYRYSGRLHESYQAAREGHKAEVFLDVDEALGVVLNLLFATLSLERYDDARAWCRLGQERFPTHTNFADCDLRILGWTGKGAADISQAWAAASRLEDETPLDRADFMWQDRRAMVAAVVARTGLADSAKAILRAAMVGMTDGELRSAVAYDHAYVYLLLGDRQEALRLLGVYLRANPESRAYIAGAPWFHPLHDDPRFRALVSEGAQPMAPARPAPQVN